MTLALVIGLYVVALLFIGLPWRQGSSGQSNALDIYREQLAELDSDLAGGRLEKAAHGAARLEIERRMLRAADGATEDGGGAAMPISVLAFLVSLMCAATSWLAIDLEDVTSQPGQRSAVLDQPIQEDGPTFGEAIKTIEDRLKAVPDDQEGLELLARTAGNIGAFQKAADAYGRLAELGDPTGRWAVQQLEAVLAITGGRVSPAASLLIDQILTDHPNHPAPAFYKGVAALQAGDEQSAYDIWSALAERSDSDAPWMERLGPQLALLRKQLGLD